MILWQQHLNSYAKRESLSTHFSFRNIDKAIQNFGQTDKVLAQLESLISPELITISEEEKLDKEIIADLKKLKTPVEIGEMSEILVYEEHKRSALRPIFQEIHDVLTAELHLIRFIRKKPANVKELLLQLFKLVFNNEAVLYKVFKQEYFTDKLAHSNISKLARAILLQQMLKIEEKTDEEKFVMEIFRKMKDVAPEPESKSQYRKLGEDIFYELTQEAGATQWKDNILEGIKRMEALMKDDAVLYRIIKKLRPKYVDAKISAVMLAFRKAYDLGHFIDYSEFAT
jgi:hypothetical protein